MVVDYRSDPTDTQVRLAAFDWLAEQESIHGEVLPWTLLLNGFSFRGDRVPLVSQQGIFKPRVLAAIPLSIRTSPNGPYDDGFNEAGLLTYKYRGTDPSHHENAGLRGAMAHRVPLVYFHGVTRGRYLATWPVYIVGDDPSTLTFIAEVEDRSSLVSAEEADFRAGEARRQYVTALARRRVHQQAFRERVLKAYRESCAFCRLKHSSLLDAAHIIADTDERGEPLVTNGLALCKLHHAAFDRNYMGVRPDYVIEVRQDVLVERDGPMLRHGLQGMNGTRIQLPRKVDDRPSRERLEERYETFRRAG